MTSLQLFDPALGVDAMPKSIEEIATTILQDVRPERLNY